MSYGRRFCLACGKEYEAEYASQLVCCKECKRARARRMLNKRRGSVYEELEWLDCQYEKLLESVRTVVGEAVAEKPDKPDAKEAVEAIAGPPARVPKKEGVVKEDEDKYPAKSKRKLKEGERYCKTCGDVFYSRNKDEKYCCSSCRLVARRKGVEE